MTAPTQQIPVAFFRQDSGREPVREWLKQDVTPVERKIIGEDILIVQKGWPVGMPVVRPLGEGLFEVRSELPTRIARVLFTIHDGHIVLLHGFIKKNQTTPKPDLDLARKRR